jgi:uncharacterized membrane protein SirB2
MIEHFCDWLSNTSISLTIQTVAWIIPAIQTVHILCVALVMSSVAMLDLRLMRLAGLRQPVSRMVNRFVPWVWAVVPLLLLTGALLIIGEPSRELLNPYFRAKMAMLVIVLGITLLIQRKAQNDANYWESRKFAAALIGCVSLVLWVGIVSAGRWIAYF